MMEALSSRKKVRNQWKVSITCLFQTVPLIVLCMSASTVHIHRLNILSTSVTLHVSRVIARPNTVAHVEFLSFCGETLAR